MIDVPTLFILGAGASKPYEYLTGAELRKDIIQSFDSYFNQISDINKPHIPSDAMRAQRQIQKFIEHFKGSSISSIDKYLALNPNDSYIGKIAITLSILKSEKESCFREDIKNANEDWYGLIFNRMTSSFSQPDDYKRFCENKVAFITFNYDRSLEYFLYDSFYHSFYEKRHEIEKNVEDFVSFPIIHVYESVADITPADWYKHGCNYRGDFNYFDSVEQLSRRIRVIGEERSDNEIKEKVKKLLKDYKRIFFLGFGYAQDNLDAIGIPENIDATWDIFGTAKGKTPKEINTINNVFPYKITSKKSNSSRSVGVSEFTHSPCIKNVDSFDLLREYL